MIWITKDIDKENKMIKLHYNGNEELLFPNWTEYNDDRLINKKIILKYCLGSNLVLYDDLLNKKECYEWHQAKKYSVSHAIVVCAKKNSWHMCM
jgi:hypothetical protein